LTVGALALAAFANANLVSARPITNDTPGSNVDRGVAPDNRKRQQTENATAAVGRCRQDGAKAPVAGQGDVLFQADALAYDSRADLVTADGKVEASFWGCVLVADHLEYDIKRDLVRANGDIAIMEPSGNVVFAKSIELSSGLEDGIVSSFSAVLAGNAHFAALMARRKPGGITELDHVIYSPCRICKSKGFEPLWQIKAVRVTHDEAHKSIRYQSATFEVKGVPVFYLPYFEHADPSIKRKSGFLVPSVGSSNAIGTYAEVPYFYAISPNQDVTVSPLFTTGAADVMMGEYRLRTQSGQIRLSGSFAYDQIASTVPGAPAQDTWRSHFFSDARFRFNDVWSYGFNAQLSSDDTYLKRYEISNLDRLRTQIYAEGFSGRSSASLESFYFQGLRATDDLASTPLVLPLGEITWYPRQRLLGGQFKVDASVLSLSRTQGADSHRLSLAGQWQRQLVTNGGHKFTGLALLRADAYYTDGLNPTNDPTLPKNSGYIGRVVPILAAEWRWPLARSRGSYSHVIEPIIQLIASSYGGNPRSIPNEDSTSFEFDDTNLFSIDKLPGLDLVETGPRANIGIRYGLYGPHGSAVNLVLGENLRLHEQTDFDPTTGFGGERSDYVGSLRVSPYNWLDFIHRFRIDRRNFSFKRNEFTGRFGSSDYWARVTYLQLSEELSVSGVAPRKEFNGETRLKIAPSWYFEGEARRDLINDKLISSGAALVFSNECAEIALQFKRNFTRDREIAPSSAFTVRIRLKTFGESSGSASNP
jgi:LPS-assembly protein